MGEPASYLNSGRNASSRFTTVMERQDAYKEDTENMAVAMCEDGQDGQDGHS
jgi:hypothetical protein